MHVDYFIRQRPKRMDKSVSSFSEPAQGQACSRTDVKCLVTGTLPEHPTSIMLPGVPNQGKPSRRLHLPLTILHLPVSCVLVVANLSTTGVGVTAGAVLESIAPAAWR